MEQHPIPQQISSYQFRLVGDMTLKQFFQLAGGALISLLIYATGLHPIIKWPLIIFFSLFGVALAFLPLEERPLEQWVIAFFRSIYSPTLFYWQKATSPTQFFQPETASSTPAVPVPAVQAPTTVFISKLEEAEKTFLSSIGGVFGGDSATSQPQVQGTPSVPQPSQDLRIPGTQKTEMPPQGAKPSYIVEETLPGKQAAQVTTSAVDQILVGQSTGATQTAQFSSEAAPPLPPEQPNTIVGQVMDPEGKIIEGAILEIKDVAGRPVRALKTNKAGHFMIVTPLANGSYELIIEKEGFIFNTVSFETRGSIIQPIAVRAKARQTEATEVN